MVLDGTVQNGMIVLDQGASLPEGTRVQVVAESAVQMPRSAKELLIQMAGCMTDLPSDLARAEDMVMLEPWLELPRPKPIALIRAHPGILPLPDPPIMPAEEEGSAA